MPEFLTSSLLRPLTHGFFTRAGGASSGIFAGLNCGIGSSDQREAGAMNRSRAAAAMGVEMSHLALVHQVHSASVISVTEPPTAPLPRADAMVSNTPGLALAVLTADCQPVLFADHEAGVIGAAHAGWKGTLNGVIENTVAAMEQLGAQRERILAVIGPTISQRAYEVGPEFLENFRAEDETALRYFANGKEGRYQFDLPGYALSRLRALGLKDAEWIGRCTYAEPDRFYSYRRSVHRAEADYGRLISIIRL